jgi:epoxyqueuosine reductase
MNAHPTVSAPALPASRAATVPPASVATETPSSLAEWSKAQAYALGFDLAGIATLGPAETREHFDRWLAAGYAGDMHYIGRNTEKRRDSRLPFPGASCAIVVALDYGGREPSGPVARYARGEDYHDVMTSMLRELHRRIEERVGRSVPGKPYVDTGPILERDLAQRAGLGWIGKNTNLLNPRIGSYFFLGSLVLDLELQADEPFTEDHCGSCTRCLDACPTQAFVEPRVLDATRCISYLTIELRGAIPGELHEAIGERLYGCDVCQEVCPWNVKFARELPQASPFAPRAALVGRDAQQLASEVLQLDEESFRGAYRRSPMKRARLSGLRRNAAVVLDNLRSAARPADSRDCDQT